MFIIKNETDSVTMIAKGEFASWIIHFSLVEFIMYVFYFDTNTCACFYTFNTAYTTIDFSVRFVMSARFHVLNLFGL